MGGTAGTKGIGSRLYGRDFMDEWEERRENYLGEPEFKSLYWL
jgi:hypothetical protein